MSEIAIGVKTAVALCAAVSSVVSAYWLARRSAAKDTAELERKLEKKVALLTESIVELAANTKDKDEIRELVDDSLHNLSVILEAIKCTTDGNNQQLQEVLIQIAVLKEKVRALEESNDRRMP